MNVTEYDMTIIGSSKKTIFMSSSEPTKIITTSSSTCSSTSSLCFVSSSYWTTTKWIPLPLLCFIWLFLCTVLVMKYPPLISVFGSFCACWCIRLVSGQPPHWSATALAGIALWWWDGTSTTIAGASITDTTTATTLTNGPTPTVLLPHHALSIIAGYLAFCHWFINQSSRVTEDALTLTFSVVILVVYYNHQEQKDEDSSVVSSCTWLNPSIVRSATTLWLVTHWLRLVLLFKNNVNDDNNHQHHVEAVQQQDPPTSVSTTTNNNNKKKKKNLDISSSSLGIWRIHGKEYDLSTYVDYHPGGREAILLGMNREDCTALFESYHPFTKSTARAVLQKYQITTNHPQHQDTVKPPKRPNFTTKQQQQQPPPSDNNESNNNNLQQEEDFFYSELCEEVATTLRRHGIDPVRDRTASWSRRIHYGLILMGVAGSGYLHFQGSIVGSFALAVFGWWLGSLGHDAGHFCVSRVPIWNDIGLWAMSLLCNPIVWQHQHTYAHHSRTNDFDADPDLHHFTALLRVHRRFQPQEIYKYQSQRIYVLFAYLFVVIGTCIWIPIGMIQDGTLYAMVEWTDRGRNRGYYGMYLHWLVYATCILVWPFFVHDYAGWAATAVLVHIGTSGWIFAMFSQINHLNEHSFLNDTSDDNKLGIPGSRLLETSWAAQQVVTSNNFCPQSRLWHILSNGLNLQIEHHLFPGLNHCHLPIIQHTVQKICEKHGVPYKSYAHWGDIMTATLHWLSLLATEPTPGSGKE